MEMAGERRIPAPRQKVWDALNDPEVLQASIPGCESIEREGEDGFRARVAVKLGPMAAKFTGKVKLENLNPPQCYTIGGEGSGGAMGFAKGGADVTLTEEGPSDTRLQYQVRAQVGGKIAQLGARLIDSTAKQMADQFFDRFAAQLTPAPAADGAAPVAGADAPPVAGPGADGQAVVFGRQTRAAAGADANAASEDAVNLRAEAAKDSPANRAATDQAVAAARGGAVAAGTDTEYLKEADAAGPITQHFADGISASGDPVTRPNPRPVDPVALSPLRLLFAMEPFGLPIQFWLGSAAMVVILALMFL